MKHFNRLAILLLALFAAGTSAGQSTQDIRFNEIFIKNTDNYADEYGRHVPWVEVFNTAYNTVDLAGCYLTDDTTGLAAAGRKGGEIPEHWYHIPKTDINTSMPQRTFAVFYMDDDPLFGTFHVNFDPTTSKTSYVALITSDGKTLIDLMVYPKKELMDTALSYGLLHDGLREEAQMLDQFTPGSTNETKVEVSKQEKLKKDDPYGIGLTIIAMSVTFTALILIYIMLKIFAHLNRKASAKKKADSKTDAATPAKDADDGTPDKDFMSGEEAAAISAALHLHFNSMHDEESEIITINMPEAHYSPWSQKGLSMKKTPVVKK